MTIKVEGLSAEDVVSALHVQALAVKIVELIPPGMPTHDAMAALTVAVLDACRRYGVEPSRFALSLVELKDEAKAAVEAGKKKS